MSLITRCPACATMFKVVADQLKVSEGWVRCGHCAEIFDASSNLVDEAAVHEGQQAVSPPSSPPPADFAPSAAPGVSQSDSRPMDLRALDSLPMPLPQGDSSPMPLAPRGGGRTTLAQQARLDPDHDDELVPEVSFVRDARRAAFWRKPGVRVLLSLLCLLLLCLLGLQVAVHERDRIAAMEPRALPLLEELCRHLDCRIEPLRQPESLVIDNSSFSRLRGDGYRLGFTVRNSAPYSIAMPSLELTVTDMQEQPVLRKVFSASELGADSPVLAGGGEWSASLAFSVGEGGAARVAGYRLFAFYP